MLHPQQISPPQLPPGWVAAVDPASGRTYFANPSTGETRWDPPPLLPPPPPPPVALAPPASNAPSFQHQNLTESHNSTAMPVQPVHAWSQQPQQQQYHQHQQTLNHAIHQPAVVVNAAVNHPSASSISDPPSKIQPHSHDRNSVGKQPVMNHPSITAATGHLFMPSIMSMLDAEKQQQEKKGAESETSKNKESDNTTSMELEGLSAGVVADLVHLSRQQQEEKQENDVDSAGEKDPYETPLDPHSMPLLAKPPPMERGRLEIRLQMLYEELNQIK